MEFSGVVNLNSTSNSPVAPLRLSCQISANQREAETSANVNKHWKTRAKGNDVITNVISANQHFASTFSMQIFKFQRRSCKLSFLFPPRRQSAPESLLAGLCCRTLEAKVPYGQRWVRELAYSFFVNSDSGTEKLFPIRVRRRGLHVSRFYAPKTAKQLILYEKDETSVFTRALGREGVDHSFR